MKFNTRTIYLLLAISMFSSASCSTLLMIEGNVGAGKTTLSSILKSALDAAIISEPVDRWQTIGGNGNILDLYYKEPTRWGYTLLSYVQLTIIEALLAADQSKELHVSDRSLYSGYYCFARHQEECGYLNTLEAQVYKEWFTYTENAMPHKPDGFIYLRTSPEDCLARMAARSRSEESALRLEFFEYIHRLHEEWLIEKKNVTPFIEQVPVLILNGNLDFKNDPIIQQQFIDSIKNFINQIKRGQ